MNLRAPSGSTDEEEKRIVGEFRDREGVSTSCVKLCIPAAEDDDNQHGIAATRGPSKASHVSQDCVY